jgi:AcrR family transcriptional regulator
VPNSQTTNRASRREIRRNDLVDAALAVFSAHGVADGSVDDIVRAAGVAKGTFYLYFRTKDDAVNAVAERIVNRVGERVEVAANNADLSAIDRLLSLGNALQQIGREPYERDLIEMFHRPENRAVHDRISERILARLSPSLTTIIADGMSAHLFRPQNPRLAAAFVLGSFTLLHHVVSDPEGMPAAATQLETFILRGLGYAGEIDP